MATETKKSDTPPYIAWGTFLSFIKGLQKTGIPSRIDKSLLRNMSGGNQSALLAALRWFKLIDDVGAHGDRLDVLVKAGDGFNEVFAGYLKEAYSFMTDGSVDLTRATGAQVEEKFKAYGAQGSTVIKTMAFFIAACKESGMQLSSHIKLPKAPKANGQSKSKKAVQTSTPDDDEPEGENDGIPDDMPGFVKIPIPLHGMDDGVVFLPDNLTSAQWAYALKITKFLIENYRPADAPNGAEGQA